VTLKIERLESQIIVRCFGALKPKGLLCKMFNINCSYCHQHC